MFQMRFRFYELVRPSPAPFLLPLKDYLFRHDRGSFWMASYRIPPSIGRYLDPLLDSTNMFKLAVALPWVFPKRQIVLQDFMLPIDRVDSFIDEMQSQLEVWPVWLLPMRNVHLINDDGTRGGVGSRSSSGSSSTALERPVFSVSRDAMPRGHFCNVGAYGIPLISKYDYVPTNKRLEAILLRHEGRKVHYSHSFYDRNTFYNEMYDGLRYFGLRQRYCADRGFPEIYDKVITRDGRL